MLLLPAMMLLPLLFMMMVFPIVIGLFIFWIITLIDCLSNEPSTGNDKLIWVLVVIFMHFIGALLYHFVRKPQRVAQFGK